MDDTVGSRNGSDDIRFAVDHHLSVFDIEGDVIKKSERKKNKADFCIPVIFPRITDNKIHNKMTCIGMPDDSSHPDCLLHVEAAN